MHPVDSHAHVVQYCMRMSCLLDACAGSPEETMCHSLAPVVVDSDSDLDDREPLVPTAGPMCFSKPDECPAGCGDPVASGRLVSFQTDAEDSQVQRFDGKTWAHVLASEEARQALLVTEAAQKGLITVAQAQHGQVMQMEPVPMDVVNLVDSDDEVGGHHRFLPVPPPPPPPPVTPPEEMHVSPAVLPEASVLPAAAPPAALPENVAAPNVEAGIRHEEIVQLLAEIDDVPIADVKVISLD